MDWRKSSYSQSDGGQCVECGTGAEAVLIRDTTDRDGATLAVSPAAWTRFLTTIRKTREARNGLA
jgi:Domain of unknown function (DUF397)